MDTKWKEDKPGRWSARIGPFEATIGFRSDAYDACVMTVGPEVGPGGAAVPNTTARCVILVPAHREVFAARAEVDTVKGETTKASVEHIYHHYTLEEMKLECEKYARHLADLVLKTADAWRNQS